jgi:hypothetical protein
MNNKQWFLIKVNKIDVKGTKIISKMFFSYDEAKALYDSLHNNTNVVICETVYG